MSDSTSEAGGVDTYDRAFYDRIRQGSSRSARIVWPLLKELLAPHPPRSIVDIGCGDGSWLAEATREFDTSDVVGVDGAYVRRSGTLRIAETAFLPFNLATQAKDLAHTLNRRFDLATSLEVAEHLPREAADAFVDALVQLAPVVMFSAAIPGQGGDSHVNEEWPDAWVSRFAVRGFKPIDELRYRIWNSNDVEFWYKQNVLLFASEEGFERHPGLARAAEETQRRGVPGLVHPDLLGVRDEAMRALTELHAKPIFRAAGMADRVLRKFARLVRHEGAK